MKTDKTSRVSSPPPHRPRPRPHRAALRDAPLWSLVGRTPLLPLAAGHPSGIALHLKCEWLNPGGSVKDRAALHILREGLAQGELPGKRLLDASSGNTAIAYAVLGSAAGVRVTVCVPANASAERNALLRAYGAEVVPTDPLEGADGAIRQAREIAAAEPDRYWYADQYNNVATWRAHYDTTAPELWAQTGGRVTHVVAGLGTTGTLVGIGRRMRELNAAVELVAVQPAEPLHGLEGLKHLVSSIVPGIYDPDVPTRHEFVATEEADRLVRAYARERGLLLGWSAGAALVAARRLELRPSACVVVVAPDSGHRYLSEAARWVKP